MANTLEIGQQYLIPDQIIDALIHQESGGNPRARGKAGELGLMQLKPQTAAQFGVKDPATLLNPTVNREVGKKYLQSLVVHYQGNIPMALAAYNAGQGNVDKGRIPASTHNYVRNILEAAGRGLSGAIGEGTAYGEDLPPALRGAKEVGNPWHDKLAGSEVPNPWGKKAGAPQPPQTFGQKVTQFYNKDLRDPATAAVTKGVGAIEPKSWQDYVPPSAIAETVVPQSPTQAGVQAGLMASGLGEIGLLGRLGLAAGGGALGSKLGGGSALTGGVEGAATAIPAEIGGALLGAAGRAIGKSKLLRDTTGAIGDFIGKHLPIGTVPRTAADLEGAFTHGEALNPLGQRMAQTSARATHVAQGRSFQSVPFIDQVTGEVGRGTMTLDQAEKAIEALNDHAYSLRGDPRTAMQGKQFIKLAADARDKIAKRLEQFQPGMGKDWLQSRKDYGAGKVFQRIFREPGVLNPTTGEIDQPRFLDLVNRKYYDQLSRTLGPDKTKQLMAVARRFAKGVKSDVPGQSGHVSIGMFGHPHASLPRTYKGVGNVPAWMTNAPYRIGVGTLARPLVGNAVEDDQENP